jgi:hypothetical protein
LIFCTNNLLRGIKRELGCFSFTVILLTAETVCKDPAFATDFAKASDFVRRSRRPREGERAGGREEEIV